MSVSGEPFITVWGTLALLGLLWCIASRRWLLPIWALLIYAIPREFPYLVVAPLALLSAYGLREAVTPAFRRLGGGRRGRRIVNSVTMILLIYGVWGAVNVVFTLAISKTPVMPDENEMMQWIRANTEEDATFLVLGNELEWFPAVTE